MEQLSQSPMSLKIPTVPANKSSFFYQMQQQILAAWKPIPTINSSIILYAILCIIKNYAVVFFASFGVTIMLFSSERQTHSLRYDHTCKSSNCQIVLNVDKKMIGPIYLYYKLTDFRQNYRYFSKSKSDDQLKGRWVTLQNARQDCGSKTTNGEMGWKLAVDGTTLNPNDVAYPCGMMAYSFFNDSFSIDGVSIMQSQIAIPEISKYYTNYNISKQGIDLQNEHFLVWMRPSSKSNFMKLWGVIHQDMDVGIYRVRIKNNYNVKFSQRWIELSSSNLFGNKNNILGIGFLAVAGISLLVMIAFIATKSREKIQNAPIFE